MNRALKTLLLIVAIIAVIGGGVFMLYYFGIIGNSTKEEPVLVYETEDGKIYTTRNWEFKPNTDRSIEYIPNTNVATKNEMLHLHDDVFVNIKVPDVPTINNNNTAIYAEDGSFSILSYSYANKESVPSLQSIVAIEDTTGDSVVVGQNSMGSYIMATYADELSIVVVNCYSNNESLSVLTDALNNGLEPYSIGEVYKTDNFIWLEELSYTGNFAPQVSYDEVHLNSELYLFEEGSLWIESYLKSSYLAKDNYIPKIMAMSNTGIEKEYNSSGFYYANSGDYHLAVITYNSNTSIVLIGKGEEAYCNIVSVINSLQ